MAFGCRTAIVDFARIVLGPFIHETLRPAHFHDCHILQLLLLTLAALILCLSVGIRSSALQVLHLQSLLSTIVPGLGEKNHLNN